MERKIAVISGGMGDIGKAISIELAQKNYKIISIFHSDKNNEFDVFSKNLSGDGHIGLKCDITKTEDLEKLIHTIQTKYGKIDVCIHCAVNPLIRKKLMDITSEEFKNQFEVTVFGGLKFFQACIPLIKKSNSGKIIGLTSYAIRDKKLNVMSGYTIAKIALSGMLKELSKELKNDNISVVAVEPKFTPTSLHKDLPKEVKDFLVDRTETNTPEDVAKIVSEICDDQEFKTGICYPVGTGEITEL